MEGKIKLIISNEQVQRLENLNSLGQQYSD